MTTDLSFLTDAPTTRGTSPDLAWAEYRKTIEDAILAIPRSQQVRIGPSEVGNPCDLCLGRKLAGVPELPGPAAWIPTVGTAVHAWLEETFVVLNRDHPAGHIRYLLEQTVSVGEIDGTEITGHCDMYDRLNAIVVDWKTVGPHRLKAYRAHGPGPTYRAQAHLYARGWTRRGLPVDHVAIAFLPRNEELHRAWFWSEPYDESIALDALARADALAKAIRHAGAGAVLPSLTALPGCDSCRRYVPGAGPFDDLV